MSVDSRLLEILICPKCGARIRELAAEPGLECLGCARVYPVRDGIPVLLVEEARPRREGP